MQHAFAICWRTLLVYTLLQCGTCMCFKLAAVGDYGVDNSNELKVANMIAAWGVDGVLALGDNNYFVGSNSTIDAQVGKYYGSFIYPYKGTYAIGASGSGSPTGTNRFWPITGNHDWGNTCGDSNSGCSASCATGSLAAHLWYMPVGGKAYYNKVLAGGLLEIFALDSDCNQRDGTTPTSVQGLWLQNALAASTATWKFVLLHHSPFSSSTGHGTNPRLQWPFELWGAHAVFSAHDHLYERITKNAGFPYFVNGAGGQSLNSFGTPESGSAVRYSTTHGAQLLTINATTADIAFYAATDATNPYASQVDCYRLTKQASGAIAYSSCAAAAPPPAAPQYSLLTGAAADDTAGTHNRVVWRYTSSAAAGGIDPAWAATSFADTAWKLGAARLGYGNDFVYNTTLPNAATGLLHHWFRVYVCLPPTAPAALGSVRLKVLSDNSAEVFVNGLRAYTDPAADHEPTYWNSLVNIAPGFVAGVNVIAVHVTNSAGSSDAAMDLDVTYSSAAPLPGVAVTPSAAACSGTPPPPALPSPSPSPPPPTPDQSPSPSSSPKPSPSPSPVPPPTQQYSLLTGAVADNTAGTHNRVAWRYTSTAAAGGIDPAWAATSFADGAWKLGAARLGYGADFVYNSTLPDAATGLLHHWFRVYVCLPAAAPAALSSVRLKVLSDNTAEVFVNGLRVYTDPTADHEPIYWNSLVDIAPGFVAGVNVIAVHVTNTAGSSDAAMDLDVTYSSAAPLTGVAVTTSAAACSGTPPPPALTSPSPSPSPKPSPSPSPVPPPTRQYSLLTGAVADNTAGTHNRIAWRYTSTAAAGGIDPAWAATSFADGGWKLGAARLGYGNDFVYNTTLPSASTGLLHHWFRVYVCLPPTAPSALGSVRLKVLSDDTAEVFVNGLRAYKDAVADHEPKYWNTAVNVSPGFVAGSNVIAVHVTNTAGSSDAAMDLDITYVAAAPLPGVVVSATGCVCSSSCAPR